MTAHPSSTLNSASAARDAFERDGYLVRRGLFAPAEAAAIREEFMRLKEAGPVPGHFEPRPAREGEPPDPLREFPRIMQPHQISALAREYLLDTRIADLLRLLLGEEPIAAQSMLYFKPPGARGQALHQDNFYLRVDPGTCIAAWTALDGIDRENGGLEVVPGTHAMDLFCPEEADSDVSFTREYVPPPPGLTPVPVDMSPGDVLFFNGSVVHGSGPNRTADRFRRSFICHYAGTSARRIAEWYPTLTMDGRELRLDPAVGGGPCGTEQDAPAVGPH